MAIYNLKCGIFFLFFFGGISFSPYNSQQVAAALKKSSKPTVSAKNAIRYSVFSCSQVECVVSAGISPLLEDGRFLTRGVPFIPEEGNNTLTWHIPPFQRIAKYTDDTSDTHFSFGLILLESAFPFPLSFLLSTVCLRCLFYSVIKIIFSGAVPFIYQPIHPRWMNFVFPGKRLSLLT